MFFSMGHGRRVIKGGEPDSDNVPADGAVGITGHRADGPVQTFGYLFPTAEAPDFPVIPGIEAKLEALAAAMAEPTPEQDALNGTLPPIFTYFGQFIDHDISVNTDSDNDTSKIGDDPLPREDRNLIDANVQNGRRGSLGLDSLYGDVPLPNDTSNRLKAALRNGPFLREGMTAPFGQRPELPLTGGDDLPRIGPMIDAGELDPADLPDAMRPDPNDPDDDRRSLAFIGDGRNDENLIVAQLHLAFIRFHNAVARKIIEDARGPVSDDAVFDMARRTVVWTYQWIVVNEFLPTICRPQDVDAVIANEAPLYREFFARLSQGDLAGLLPLPLEFSAGAYRYGHTMVRQNYDFNRNFGRPSFETDGPERATLTQMFQFTGRSVDGSDPFGPAPGPVLPHNWVIEWNRFVESRPLFRDRLARAIDTRLAPDLFNMVKEEQGVFKNLALRNLRRGYNMNLPSGQAMLAAMRAKGVQLGPVMTKARLTAGVTGRALRQAELDDHTPFWFYVLKEAEEMENGARLGTVGSHLVADTIIGLLIADKTSFWHAPGSGPGGRWRPHDGVQPLGAPVVNITALLQAAGVLAAPAPVPARSSFALAGMTALASAATSMIDKAQVRLDVLKHFEEAFRPVNERYWALTPNHKDVYDGNLPGWQLDYFNKVDAPLAEIYPKWKGKGLTPNDLKLLFSKSFNLAYEDTIASIIAALEG